ncbi:SusC/RagA family TonB-linked outer membrane protein [Flavobacterium sp. TMP13]|uniref:SusC/RagA family TonB-linked outer membrane protein n=1 Tax=Flavobacterium sp. TMP13 TaxID=3425950 RepID=UPI003D777A22
MIFNKNKIVFLQLVLGSMIATTSYAGNSNEVKFLEKYDVLATRNVASIEINTNLKLVKASDVAFDQITGKVVDEQGLPLPGVNIVKKGAQMGASSDMDGSFTIDAKKGDVFIFSYLGFTDQEVQIKDNSMLTIVLRSQAQQMNEVVVVGYGTVKRKDLTGSVSTLSAKAFKNQPVLDGAAAIQGRVAGVSVSANSGAPGGDVKIRIRGANSINGSNSPLYVVDGIALGSIGFNQINVNDIESMEVLKDASATAIYGSRGANGVIIITTKKGKSGVAKIEFNNFTSFNSPMEKYDVMDAVTYAKIANLSAPGAFANPDSFAGKGTDWQDLIFANSITTSNQLSVSGGSESVKYFVSGFHIDQGGLLINTGQKKFGGRSNVDIKISSKLSLGVDVFASRIEGHNNDDYGYKGNPVMGAVTWAPTELVYDSEGIYNVTGVSPIWNNPYMTSKETNKDFFRNIGSFNGKIKYTITDWLSFTNNSGLEMLNEKAAYLQNQWLQPSYGSGQSYSENYTFQNSSILEFNKTFDKHNVNAVAVLESLSNTNSGFKASGSGLASLTNGYYNLGLNASQAISSYYSDYSLLSYLGRVSYGYDDRFLLTASLRRDGSSKFQGDNKWSTFPSVGAAWKLSNESFIQDLDVVSNLKLRAGWGITGSQAINPYSTLGLLNNLSYSYGTGVLSPAYSLGSPSTPDLKWETTEQKDFGIDVSFLNNRLNISADYYDKKTSDLLLKTVVNNYDGGGSFFKNVGVVSNKGFELVIDGTPIKTDNFQWSSGFNFASNKNKVQSLGKDDYINIPHIGGGLITTNIQVVKVGESMGAFYLIPWEGVYQTDEGTHKAGDAKYKDVSGNGSIGFEDRVVSGSATPKIQAGFNNTFTYKKFELNVFFQGSFGNKVFNATYAAAAIPTSDNKFITLADAANYWTPTNTSSTWANPGNTSKSWIESTQFLQDGSYVRMKNISLSYDISKDLLKFADIKLTVSAQNYLTFTKYKGFDPEASTVTGDTNAGVDLGAYPSPKTITVGGQIRF